MGQCIIENEYDLIYETLETGGVIKENYGTGKKRIQILAETPNVKDYIKKMEKRDAELNFNWGTICPLVQMMTADGKMRKIQAADTKALFRIIQSIPSKKAEPFKQWLAKVGAERIEETEDPELSFDRAMKRNLIEA